MLQLCNVSKPYIYVVMLNYFYVYYFVLQYLIKIITSEAYSTDFLREL